MKNIKLKISFAKSCNSQTKNKGKDIRFLQYAVKKDESYWLLPYDENRMNILQDIHDELINKHPEIGKHHLAHHLSLFVNDV